MAFRKKFKQIIFKGFKYCLWEREFYLRFNPYKVHYELDIQNFKAPDNHIHKYVGVQYGLLGVHKNSCRLGVVTTGTEIELYTYIYISGEFKYIKFATIPQTKVFVSFTVMEHYTEMYVTYGPESNLITKLFKFDVGLMNGFATPSNFYYEGKDIPRGAPQKLLLEKSREIFVLKR